MAVLRKGEVPGFAAIDTLVNRAVEDADVPGCALGVLREGVVATACYGITNADHPLPIDQHTFFRLGSTTKVFTALAAMHLAHRGQLDIDVPVRRYMPDLRLADPSTLAGLTARHLMQHTAGWEDTVADFGAHDASLQHLVEALAFLPQVTPLGMAWSYNNSAVGLLGRLIERIHGARFDVCVDELVLDPAGLGETTFHASDIVTRRVAAGHERRDSRFAVLAPWAEPRADWPSGGLVSTISDMLRFVGMQLGQSAPDFLDAPTRIHMQSSLVPADGVLVDAVGLAWLIEQRGEIQIVGHGGTSLGQTSECWFIPQAQLGLVVLCNGWGGQRLSRQVLETILEEWLGCPQPTLPERIWPTTNMVGYEGVYGASDVEWTVDAIGDELTISQHQLATRFGMDPRRTESRAHFYRDDHFVISAGALKGLRGRFPRIDGKVYLSFGGRLYRRVRTRSG